MTRFHLAQVNIGRLTAPLDSRRLAGFVAALDSVNVVADAAPGFVWRLQTEDGNATAIRAFEQDAEIGSGRVVVTETGTPEIEPVMRRSAACGRLAAVVVELAPDPVGRIRVNPSAIANRATIFKCPAMRSSKPALRLVRAFRDDVDDAIEGVRPP